MTDGTEKVLASLRMMAWERARGELKALLHTYYPEYDPKTGQRIVGSYDRLCAAVQEFIDQMEGEIY